MAVKVILPNLAEGVNEATVSYWHLQEGDEVKEGQDLVEMATDKATFNLPAPASGILGEIIAEEGSVVRVGEALATIQEA